MKWGATSPRDASVSGKSFMAEPERGLRNEKSQDLLW